LTQQNKLGILLFMIKKTGFSLIELIIVLAIIGLISSMLFPNFASIQTKAKESSLKAVGHSIQVAVESYFLTKSTYPEGTDMELTDLVNILIANQDLKNIPVNPFTGKIYTNADSSGKITYTYDNNSSYYSILGYGLENEKQVFALQNY